MPAAESLFVAPDFRPVHWSSVLGAARLAVEFVGDSLYGATSAPTGKHNIVLEGRPDLVVSGAMMETLLSLLPLTPSWSDSVAVLAVDAVTSVVMPVELAVVGDGDLPIDTVSTRACWTVALRAGPRHALYWIDKESGAALRVEQPLPARAGTSLEYRVRMDTAVAPPLW